MSTVTPRLRRFIEIVAAERTRNQPNLFDDCVQEGMIAAWQAMEAHPDKPDVYYRAAAKNGVLNLLRNRAAFGHESMRGRQDASAAQVSLWVTTADGEEVMIVDPPIEAPYEAVDIQGDVRRAVASLELEDRLLVHGRYWEDLPFAELADRLGRPAGTLSRRWSELIRPALARTIAN